MVLERAARLIACVGIATLSIFSTVGSALADAKAVTTLPYEAFISDTDGTLVADGAYEFTFVIYDSLVDGEPLWTETHTGVPVKEGHILLELGSAGSPLTLPFDQQYYLSVQIGAEPPLSPRVKLPAAPYAFNAKRADGVAPDSITDKELAAGSVTNDKIVSVDWTKVQGVPEGILDSGPTPSNVWSTDGNRSTDGAVDYLGTGDAQPLVVKTNSSERMRVRETGELDVVGDVNLGRDLDVQGNATIHKNLGVDLNATVGGNATVDGTASVGSHATVGGNTLLNGTLNVKGKTLIENTTNVTPGTPSSAALGVAGGVGVGQDLAVQGTSKFNATETSGQATFNGPADFNNLTVRQNLTVNQTSTLKGATQVQSTLSVTQGTTLNTLTTNGAVSAKEKITADKGMTSKGAIDIDTSAAASTAAALKVTSSTNPGNNYVAEFVNKQSGNGLLVKMDVPDGQTSTDNNLITFKNSQRTLGRIEAQTYLELLSDPAYIAAIVLEAGILVAEGIAVASSLFEASDIASLAFDAAYWIVQFEIDAFTYGLNGDRGVTYESGNGDYAEYLRRANPSEPVRPGDVVGVKSGMISRDTQGAEQLMVVSTAPIVLGNMPPEGEEDDYEQVAFMGQVPVRVLGVVQSGDYIVPSGREDGTAVAVAPEMMVAADYAAAVGRAWSSSAVLSEKYVNVVVGVGARDVATLAERQEKQIAAMRDILEGHDAELASLRADLASLASLVRQGAQIQSATWSAPLSGGVR